MKNSMTLRRVAVALVFAVMPPAIAEEWFPFPVDVWTSKADINGQRDIGGYIALPAAEQRWKICVSVPRVQDDYWRAIIYGIAGETRRLGASMRVLQVGGYGDVGAQIAQVDGCVGAGANALIVSSVSSEGLNDAVAAARRQDIPVINLVSNMQNADVSAKSMVSYAEMGATAAEFVSSSFPPGDEAGKVAWFPGPSDVAWAVDADEGFRDAVENANIEIVAAEFGDILVGVQIDLINKVLAENPDLDYIVGTAETAVAAVKALESADLSHKVKVLAYYYTDSVHKMISLGNVVAAVTDQPVVQGRIAVDQAVRLLEGKPVQELVGPKVFLVSQEEISIFDTETTLPPANYSPQLRVE